MPDNKTYLAWGAKVSSTFRQLVRSLAVKLGMPDDGANWLMSCMAFESGETFSAHVRNAAGSGAVGLIQFMPSTARALGTTTDALALLSAEAQLAFVEKYFEPYKDRLKSLSDVYMAILWPAAIGKPEDHVLWDAQTRPTTFRQNAGLDVNKDAVITKGEAASKVMRMLSKGLLDGNVAV